MAMFTATNLLSTKPVTIIPPSEDAFSPSFIPNGLLSAGFQSRRDDPQTTELDELSSPSFVGNGLLPTSASRASVFQSSPLQDSQTILPSDVGAFVASDTLRTFFPTSVLEESSSSTSLSLPGSSVRARTYDGRILHLKRKPKLIAKGVKTVSSFPLRRDIGLLDIPIHKLMDQLSSVTAAKLQLENVNQSPSITSDPSRTPDDMLWVDKYRPRKFTDLLGNERVARDAMTWLKHWDYCVFGKSKGKKRSREDEDVLDLDEFRRPRQKILLLSGPPGLGKTTLAHVLASQAGYEAMEINASDARSGSVVDERIRPALESGFTVGSTKPTLLIIDEIDGATGSGDNSSTFIHKLVQLVESKPQKKGKHSRTKRPILRPIICICNDHNASSLAKLRPQAQQIRCNRPADVHLVRRLKEICEVEGLRANSRALSTLVSTAKGDLRGCMNTLQLLKARNEDVTENIIRKVTLGMKETDSTVVSVLNNLFSPLTKKQVKDLGLTEDEDARYVSRLVREIDASGRESTIATGCFGHYAKLRRHDPRLSRHGQAVEWLTIFDSFSSAMYSDGEFSLSPYLPYTLAPFYHFFQERNGERVERNQVDWEHLMLLRSNEEICKSLSRCLRSATIKYGGDYRHLVNSPILQVEFLPYINRIISPPLRPVNSQVIRAHEKELMARLVDIMATLELRFVQERADDGQQSYRLDPAIDVFVTYDSKRASDLPISRYAVRHLVSGEIEAKLIARNTEFVEKEKRGKHDFFGRHRTEDSVENVVPENPNKKAKIKDDRDIADKPPTDFFGRPIITTSANVAKTAARTNLEKKYRVQYKFLEGNSAAVRRPVKVAAFI